MEWLGELLDALLKTHIRLGEDLQETKVLLEKHKKFVEVAQVFWVSSAGTPTSKLNYIEKPAKENVNTFYFILLN